MIRKQIAVLAIGVLAVSGCATQMYGTVLPKGDGLYHAVEKGQTERDALKMAQHDAEATCKQQNRSKSFVTLEHSSEFVGVDVNDGDSTASSIAANVVEFAGRMHSKENYKVEMTFRCDGVAAR